MSQGSSRGRIREGLRDHRLLSPRPAASGEFEQKTDPIWLFKKEHFGAGAVA